MKNLPIYVLLAALATSALCQNNYFDGHDSAYIFPIDDPESCILNLQYEVQANKVIFYETAYNPYKVCSYPNLTFTSMFWNYQASGSVNMVQDASVSYKYRGEMTKQQLIDNNGTACINVQPHEAGELDFYVCRFTYGYKLIDFFLAVDGTTGVFQAWTKALFPVYGATVLVHQNATDIWKAGNNNYTNAVGMLYKDCGADTWSTRIPSGNNEVYVTGTISASQRINLQSMFSDIMLFSAIVRKSNSTKEYKTNYILNFSFNNAPVNNCSDIGVKYEDIVGSDMAFCSGGCEVSFYMQGQVSGSQDLNTYVLRTSGFTYAPNSLRG